MASTQVNDDGSVTVPKEICEKLGIQIGASVEFVIFGRQLEMVVQIPRRVVCPDVPSSGYGMLKSNRPPAPLDFDPATVLK